MKLQRLHTAQPSPADREALREQAEAAARSRYPDADEIRVNASHHGGPTVEVYKGGDAAVFRYEEWVL